MQPSPAIAALQADAKLNRLADDMREIAATSGSVEVQDLTLRGWPRDYLTRHTEAASLRAFAASEGAR